MAKNTVANGRATAATRGRPDRTGPRPDRQLRPPRAGALARAAPARHPVHLRNGAEVVSRHVEDRTIVLVCSKCNARCYGLGAWFGRTVNVVPCDRPGCDGEFHPQGKVA